MNKFLAILLIGMQPFLVDSYQKVSRPVLPISPVLLSQSTFIDDWSTQVIQTWTNWGFRQEADGTQTAVLKCPQQTQDRVLAMANTELAIHSNGNTNFSCKIGINRFGFPTSARFFFRIYDVNNQFLDRIPSGNDFFESPTITTNLAGRNWGDYVDSTQGFNGAMFLRIHHAISFYQTKKFGK